MEGEWIDQDLVVHQLKQNKVKWLNHVKRLQEYMQANKNSDE